MSRIRTALLSVYDKTGLADFSSGLSRHGVRLISTGGSARHLSDAGLEVASLEEVTGQGEMLGGRVKTLHPAVFGGILARREDATQMHEIADMGIEPIDLVVVNLYPFRSTVATPGHRLIDALEQIDIGGVSLLRAAYKNFSGVVVVVDPADYESVLDAMDAGEIGLSQRLGWARKAVEHTASYEAAICNYLSGIDVASVDLESSPEHTGHPDSLALVYRQHATLRYGENPHQAAVVYAESGAAATGLLGAEQLQGRELSFNNYLDADTAWRLAWALPSPGVMIIKHSNPCGAAIAATPAEAYRRARATDPTSAFGGIVGLNCTVDARSPRSWRRPSSRSSSLLGSKRKRYGCSARNRTYGCSGRLRRARISNVFPSFGRFPAASWCKGPTPCQPIAGRWLASDRPTPSRMRTCVSSGA